MSQNKLPWICFKQFPHYGNHIVVWFNQTTQESQFRNPYCGVVGCHTCIKVGQRHFCTICGGSDHRAKSHYRGKILVTSAGYCGLFCTSCSIGQTHFCKICGGSDHRAKEHFA